MASGSRADADANAAAGSARPDFYTVLSVSRNATEAELRRAYREQALRFHPDKNPERVAYATEQFKLVAEAYSVLKDSNSRAAYDNCMAEDRSGSNFGSGDFSFDRATTLFSEVFGPEIAGVMGRAAAGLAAAPGGAFAAATKLLPEMPRVRSAVTAACGNMLAEAEAELSERLGALERSRASAADAARNVEAHREACEDAARRRGRDHDDAARRYKSSVIQAAVAVALSAAFLFAAAVSSFGVSVLICLYCLDDMSKCHSALHHMEELHASVLQAEGSTRAQLEQQLQVAEDAVNNQLSALDSAREKVTRARDCAKDFKERGPSLSSALTLSSHLVGQAAKGAVDAVFRKRSVERLR
eukprot:TRINITY_DN14308_c0_g1_i2.p1 TRINITY_DN14308_c0_g1~~TRINITY_DN14308_c0_g1_i2.p1  ORF type:complete len:368 (-),score=85.88 TRINITY_DN14308_c0_g1_i2:24-1097(-)